MSGCAAIFFLRSWWKSRNLWETSRGITRIRREHEREKKNYFQTWICNEEAQRWRGECLKQGTNLFVSKRCWVRSSNEVVELSERVWKARVREYVGQGRRTRDARSTPNCNKQLLLSACWVASFPQNTRAVEKEKVIERIKSSQEPTGASLTFKRPTVRYQSHKLCLKSFANTSPDLAFSSAFSPWIFPLCRSMSGVRCFTKYFCYLLQNFILFFYLLKCILL